MAARQEGQTLDVEILVHVTAPSRTADDAVYRQLAQSYLSFQPHRHTPISVAPTLKRQHERAPHAAEEGAPIAIDFATVPSGQPWVPESQDLSFRSVYDNRYSPPLQEKCSPADASLPEVNDEGLLSTQLATQDEASSWQAPPSQINDSYPLPDAEIRHTTPTRVLEHYLRNLPPSSQPRPLSADRSDSPVNPYEVNIPSSIPIPPDVDEAASQSLGYKDNAKIVPVTPRVPGALARMREEPSATVIDETIYISSSAIDTASEATTSFRAESAPPPSKRHKGLADEEAVATNLHRSASDTGPSGNKQPIASSSITAKDPNDLEIRPPTPPTGIAHLEPSNLVSDKLDKLARDLSSRYRPKVNRPTDPFERGYWLVECASWSQEIHSEAWTFLANYLRSGLAGWGVWCRRDETHCWIRLYCWAHVAKHTYLLLYLASGRHLKVTGAKWIDGDGEVVIEVPPAEK
ncbi:uncharacterized protein TrAFT101_007164 [Trichoderma asperellum]|uniref:Uncharacterized protein n=1 Tax=Trichoderma asperellum (strain ATCC 204424 / CBS 433.97 / NBRC 101777) TaxID=1042311 RepID=A0A2T3YWN3_TRIA4|nr:hypothetical protein M441DRAFT_61707 [Trichoderma asperellum CBS 433.97]PTB36981.1 hypothetical protein M441DRAFT_61707 [Trichoderma asperellum CBS 433.97]UKZ92201.1 hypothetical protein TrAFT101_007164 [Trichoderma asperellum]